MVAERNSPLMGRYEHLNTLRLRLSHEKARLERAKTDSERKMRSVWVQQIEKEISQELSFLKKDEDQEPQMTDDELLCALFGGPQ